MRAIIALVFWTLCLMLPSNAATPDVVIVPAVAMSEAELDTIAEDAFDDAWCEFTNLFNSYTYKVSKNGRSMINGKFVAMPKGRK